MNNSNFFENIFMWNKKGDITSKQLVGIILLVAGFAIILLVYTNIGWEGITDQEICRNSVIFRATQLELLDIKAYVPLNCKTEKVCVRGSRLLGSGECQEFALEEKVTYENVRDVRDVEKLIADKTVECWQMMGEGELSLFQEGLKEKLALKTPQASCIICSRIAFDEESLKERNVNLSQLNVQRFMLTNNVPGKDYSYYVYFRGGRPLLPPQEELVVEDIRLTEEESREVARMKEENPYEEMAILFMQIATPPGREVFMNTLKYGAGGAAFAGGIVGAWPILKGSAKCIASGYCVAAVAVGLGIQQIGAEYNRGVVAGHCGRIGVWDGETDGCSIVISVPYEFEIISEFCDIIESQA